MPESDLHSAALDALTLLAVPRVGIRDWHRRVRESGNATLAVQELADSPHVDAARAEAEIIVGNASRLGAHLIVHGSVGYPAPLNDLTACDDPSIAPAPPVLFAFGNLELLARPTVAIVGTRHATAAGLRAAERIAHDCAEAGALVISGLARGIDAAAHTGALRCNGSTAAIIGTGLDVAYPADHRGLQQQIARDALVITEQPPGARATRGSFPERNRLIAALAQLTIVVEAGHRSGALLTAHAAGSLNRACAAAPGAFDSAASLGSNQLLRDGAQVIASVDDALALLDLARADDAHAIAPHSLTAAERAIWDVLGNAPLNLDVVVDRSGWAADACLAAVTTLELKGLVRSTFAGALHRA